MIGTYGELAARTRGRIVSGDGARRPAGVSIDTRTLVAGDVFFAIRGPVHDAHAFVADAARAGASGVVVHDPAAAAGLPPDVVVVAVGETTRALQDLASVVRRESGVTVAAITGSVGKTTTKELARLLVAGDRPTHASPGNLNNHHGLPLAILRMPEGTRACVLELGISTPGEMDRLVEIAAPDVGLVTIVSPVHVGNFASFEQLCEEKMKLPRGSARAVLNADDPEQARRRASVTAPVTSYGAAEGADVRLAGLVPRGLLGSRLAIEEGGERVEVDCPLPGEHQARNLLAACALARALGVGWDVIRRQAPQAVPAKRRGQVLEVSGITVVDDTYNANPRAMRAALDLLETIATTGRRVAVLGDMLELGALAPEEHRRLGEMASSRVDVLVGVGPESQRMVDAARAGGVEAHHLPDAEAAGAWMAETLVPGDVALVKASRGIGLDRAVDRLLAAHHAGEVP